MYDEATKHFAEILQICRERGMKLPFIICAASPNGSVFCMRFNGPGGEPDVLASTTSRADLSRRLIGWCSIKTVKRCALPLTRKARVKLLSSIRRIARSGLSAATPVQPQQIASIPN